MARRLHRGRALSASTVACAALFVGGLLVAGAFGDTGPFSTLSGTTSTPDPTSASSTATGTTPSPPTTTSMSTGATTTPQPSGTSPYIVTFESGVSPTGQEAAIAAAGATDVSAIAALRMHAITLPADTAEASVAT